MLQSYSLDLMVTDSCIHHVIVEDNGMTQEEWLALLGPYYTRHRLNLIPGNALLSTEYYENDSAIRNGWHRSAVLKLLTSQHVQADKYLILDSKNFFVHEQNLNDWPIHDGNGILETYDSRGWSEIDSFCAKHDIPVPTQVYNSSTPFVLDTATVKEIVKFDILPLFFNKKSWWSSEIFLYSIFTQYLGQPLTQSAVPNVTFWNTERALDKTTLNDCYTWPNMRAFGLHRDVLKLKTDLTQLMDFLIEIGFDSNTVTQALEQYRQDIGKV